MPIKKGDKDIPKMGGLASATVRWRDKDPATVRNKHIRIAVSEDENAMIEGVAKREGISKTEAIIRAVVFYEREHAADIF